ncbi:MAG: hypothetical protein ABW082_13900 [Sedimenticola sp.]
MSIKKNGIVVKCENCCCLLNEGNGGFDVDVPISDSQTGVTGEAVIHCIISNGHHTVELMNWKDSEHHIIEPPRNIQKRLTETLEFVAENRICGNQNLCPSEVVRIAKEYG